jgi:hypothetical protein
MPDCENDTKTHVMPPYAFTPDPADKVRELASRGAGRFGACLRTERDALESRLWREPHATCVPPLMLSMLFVNLEN